MKLSGALVVLLPLLVSCAPQERQEDSKAAVSTAVVADAPFHVDDGTADGSARYDRRPQILTQVAPRYPLDAMLRHVEGTVTVEILIDDDGRVARAQVLESLTPVLDAAAVECVRAWRFLPAMRDGNPVQAVARVPVEFRVG